MEIIGCEGQKQNPNTNKMTKTKEKDCFSVFLEEGVETKEPPKALNENKLL